MSRKIIDSVSVPTISDTFTGSKPNRAATVYMMNDANGDLTAGDTATIQISPDGGITWANLIKDGNLVQLTDQNNHESVYGLGTFRLNLTNVTGPLSAYVNEV